MAKRIKKVTPEVKDEIVEKLKKLLKDCGSYEYIWIVWNGKSLKVKGSQMYRNEHLPKDDPNYLAWTEPVEVFSHIDEKTSEPWKASDYDEYADDDLITFFFEGSPLYEFLQGSFGWSIHDKFEAGLENILKPYGLTHSHHYSYAIGVHRD